MSCWKKRGQIRCRLRRMTAEPGFAPAKINLALHVTGQRADGYHLLDSLVAFADVGDQLSVQPSVRLSLRVTGPRADGVPDDDSNLVLRAAKLAGITGAFTLDKHLPMAGGIGGGSSDAAACLRLAGFEGDSLPLGADLPVCMLAQAARMSGIGEVLTPIALPPLPAVLVNPGVEVPTPAVFGALANKDNPGFGDMPEACGVEEVIDWLALQRNDLEAPAQRIAPEITGTLQALAGAGAALARMSGSGATCFGLFETQNQAELAAEMIATLQDEWWVTATLLR